MAESDPTLAETDPLRARFEQGIAVAAPLLDLILAVGERVSRIAEPVDYEYYPVRDPDAGGESADGEQTGDPAPL